MDFSINVSISIILLEKKRHARNLQKIKPDKYDEDEEKQISMNFNFC